MKDNWLNVGFLGDELKPYIEPDELIDEKRIGKILTFHRKFLYLL